MTGGEPPGPVARGGGRAEEPRPDVPGILLAAGGSRRFGGPGEHKLLSVFDGRALVRLAADVLRTGGARPLYAVVGSRAEGVAAALPGDFEVIPNPRWAEGQGTSLARGVEALEPDAPAVLVALGDEPGLRPSAVAAVLAAWRRHRPPAVRAVYRDRPGHPVVLGRAVFPELRGLAGDEGAGRLLRGLDGLLEVRLDFEAPRDVDTRADRRRLRDRGRSEEVRGS